MKLTIDGKSCNSRLLDRRTKMPRDLSRTAPPEIRWPRVVFLAVVFAAAAWSWAPLFLAVVEGYETGGRMLATDRYEVTR